MLGTPPRMAYGVRQKSFTMRRFISCARSRELQGGRLRSLAFASSNRGCSSRPAASAPHSSRHWTCPRRSPLIAPPPTVVEGAI
eukprot:scaffold3418_cov124-Isochrysis_galbana.AAC.17